MIEAVLLPKKVFPDNKMIGVKSVNITLAIFRF